MKSNKLLAIQPNPSSRELKKNLLQLNYKNTSSQTLSILSIISNGLEKWW